MLEKIKNERIKQMGLKKSKKICICLLIIFLIFSPIILFDFSNHEKIEKELAKISKNNKSKELDQEGETYRLVTSADNVQVPVPKGYVASQIEGENYVTPEYQYITNTYKGNYIQLNWSSPEGEQYPWTQDENGIWISGNQGIPNSESILESEVFNYIEGTTLTINYTFSNESMDSLEIELVDIRNNMTKKFVSSVGGNMSPTFDYTTSNYTCIIDDWGTGRYKVRARFRKNYTSDGGLDSGYIKTSTYFKEDENGENIEVDIKTQIHDGGFVIYQLTDEELETDPNGTSININDTNKDEAQRTRNQYVWVPVENIEDIVRTKVENNGIMQFGQGYVFSNTSITKDTSYYTGDLGEPRLSNRNDITKHYLQRYSNKII